MVKLDMKVSSRSLVQSLGWIAITGALALPVTDGIGVLLSPGYNPVYGSVSQLALGPRGWIQNIGRRHITQCPLW